MKRGAFTSEVNLTRRCCWWYPFARLLSFSLLPKMITILMSMAADVVQVAAKAAAAAAAATAAAATASLNSKAYTEVEVVKGQW